LIWLYDLPADPHEINNLAKSTRPEHKAELKKLRGVLEQWIEDTHDQGRLAEPADEAPEARKPQAEPIRRAKPKNKSQRIP